MTIEHSAIADPFIHESKGVSTAGAGTVYVANGSGSGTWQSYFPADYFTMIFDINAAASGYLVSPIAGTITKIYVVSDAATDTATTNLTFKISGTTITNGAIAIASGVTAGTSSNSTPTANNVIAVGNVFSITSDGGTGSACNTRVTVLVSPRTA